MKYSALMAAAFIGLMGATATKANAQTFDFTFDEYGHGLMHINGTPGYVSNPGYLGADVTGGVAGPVLIYDLPTFVGPGDIAFFDPADVAVVFSDVFRFYNDNVTGHLIFYSDLADEPNPGLADSGMPQNLDPTAPSLPEIIDRNGNGVCNWIIPGDNAYHGISDGVVPEPASMTLVGLGVVALVRRRKAAK